MYQQENNKRPTLLRAEYVGTDSKLYGKEAELLITEDNETVKAKFDDVSTGFGYGWHTFSVTRFNIWGRPLQP